MGPSATGPDLDGLGPDVGGLDRDGSPSPPAGAWFRRRDVIALAVVAAALLLPLRGLLRLPGPPMEEGFMLTFPERLLRGEIPNRDFLHLYGPGSVWVLAGVYKVFGASLEVQRLFGLVQQAAVAYGVFFVARWWGRRVAVTCALLAILLMLPPAGLTAFAWTGGVGAVLLGLAVGLHARATPDDRRGFRLAVAAGILFGIAFLYRIDLVVACALTIAVIAWRAPRARALGLVGGALGTAALLLAHVAMAGFGNAFRGMVLEPVFELRDGRRLPVPPSWGTLDGFLQMVGDIPPRLRWPLPTPATSQQLFLWFFANLAAITVLIVVGARALRREPHSVRARAVLAAGLLSLGMVSQTLQRPDSTHIAWVSCVSIGLLPIALMEARWRAGRRDPTHPVRGRRLVACGVPALFLLLVVPNFTYRAYADFVAQTFDRRRASFAIERDGRRFYYGDPSVADAANAMIPTLDRLVRPGDRLFVGPTDLRRTVTSEAWLYALYPEAVPGTYFIEMDPGIANARGSRMAADLRRSDVVVLSRIWQEWNEANDSSRPGDPTPDRVLRERFCPVGTFAPWFDVYRRCDRTEP
ncbi:MAG: hypothetical protein FJW77_07800 [Actinobacteria bacterium]|nr:hypothetical protein [Actinomycetota bacterium]